jgi:hypothetical protein
MLTRNDFAFQGYSVPKDKPSFNVRLLKKWEREAAEQAWIEYLELDGENNDFLEVYPQSVKIYHKTKAKKKG